MRTHRFFVSVLVAGALVAAGFMNPGLAAAAQSAAGTSSLPVSCSAPPDDPDATAANRDRFVDLWSHRFADHDWLTAYAKLPSTPTQILDEGFHAMSQPVKVWLESCLLDDMLRTTGKSATAEERNQYLIGEQMLIFGKNQLNAMRNGLTDMPQSDAPASQLTSTPGSATTAQGLAQMSHDLVSADSFTKADQPQADGNAPSPLVAGNVTGQVSEPLKSLVHNGQGTTRTTTLKPAAAPSVVPVGLEPNPITKLPLVPLILKAVNELLQLISKIQGILFTLPVVNILASAFYKICAESATMPLSCSISLPIGVPIPADVTGDNVPDVLGALFPVTNLKDVGAKFQVTRLHSAPLPAHVFAVYDTPIVKKRIEVGFDGRASSLAYNQGATFTVKNVVAALTGDVQVGAVVTAAQPGPTEALTFAVKDLVGGSAGVLPSEENPVAGSVQMNPFPEKFTVDARLTHSNAQDEDTFNVTSTVPTTVTAQVNQKTTTTSPKSDRTFTALIDKLPTEVTVDLIHQGEKQSIDYQANAGIAHVQATDTATPDVSHLGSYTQSQYDVFGVPTAVHVDLKGAQDIKYTANGNIPTASFNTKTLTDGVLQQQINATAHQIPKSIHVTNVTTADQQAVTYDADSNLGDVALGMYDKSEAGDETNLVATALSIPTHLAFTQTKSTGVYDLSANQGIGKINASLTRNGGSLIPRAGDHATVLKQGTKLGLDFQLTGFKSAHFDGHQKTDVSLGLDPGGQSFDAIADLDDPNVLATAHIDALPSSMHVVFDPDTGHATYAASSVIPEMDASFDDRVTHLHGDATLHGLPKNIDLTFNTSGATPSATYSADSRLTSIELNYSEKPGGLAIRGLINDLPKYMSVGGLNPMVFDARTGPSAAPASSDIGKILFQYGSDGTFVSPLTPDDHAYLDTDLAATTHAELLYSGLSFISVDTTDQALHLQLKNSSPRLFRAYVTTPTVTATGFIDKVPASIDVLQDGNKITYTASSVIDEIGLDATDHDGDHVAVDVTDVPAQIGVTFDGANSQLDWAASSVAGGFSALAHLVPATIGGTRAFDAGLTIADIPTAWHAGWAGGDVSFVTNGTGIGSIDASVTNHTSVHTLSGDHLHAYFDEPSGDLDASLHISNLQSIGYSKITDGNGGGFQANLNMGDHGQLNFGADVTLSSGDRLHALGNFTHLPSHIVLKSDGGRITYTGDDNPDLTLAVDAAQSAAALAATPGPSTSIHGVSVRDGQDGSGKRGVRAYLFITGLPDDLDLNSPAGTYQVNGFHPSNPTLSIDAQLTTLAPQPLTLEVAQVVPTAAPVDFKFGPFLSDTAGDGTHTLSLTYTSNQDLGALTAEATYGNTDDAQLEISEIPKSINVNASFGASQKSVGVTMNHGIDHINAAYKKVGDVDFAASVKLHDVPSAVNLLLGRATAADGSVATPDFTLTASQPGLDIDATATAAITDPLDANAAADLKITNMGSTVTGQLDGTTLKINSSPATEKFALNASGAIHLNVDLGFDAGPLTNTGTLGVNVDIHKLTLGFSNASSLQLDLGITTGLKGDYDDFTFGIDSKTVIDLKDTLHLIIGTPFGDVDIDIFKVDPAVHINLDNVIDHFRLASNRLADVFSIEVIDVIAGYCSFDIKLRPHAEGSTSGSSFTVGQPPSDGSNPPAWLITPDPNFLGVSIPDFVVDIVMYFTSPYGHDIGAGLGCHSRI